MLPSRWWSELTWSDFDAVDMAAQIAVLPLAAVEQHGSHLPLGTDSIIAGGYLDAVVARLPSDLPAVFLPVQTIGSSIEHADFPGTLTLSARSALQAWTDLIDSVARAGCRKLVVVNAHGGNSPVLDILAQEGRARHGMLIVRCAWARFGYPPGLFSDFELAHGIHGGAVETSLMLAFRPDLVRHADLETVDPPLSAELAEGGLWLRAHGRPTGIGWMAQDLHASGIAGDPSTATREKGEACAQWAAAAFVELLAEVGRFDLARLRERS